MHNQGDLNQNMKSHMSDADRLMDCLASSKERAMLYAKAALEATNNGVREFFLAMHGEETHNAEISWSFMHTRGHYPVQMATEQAIQKARANYQAMHQQLGLTDAPSMRRYHTTDPKMPPAHMQNPAPFDYKGDTH